MANAILTEPRFTNDEAARQHLESIRWPNGPVCPHCGGTDRTTHLQEKRTAPDCYPAATAARNSA